MTYHFKTHTKALGLAAAVALSPMAASAASVDINIQSFGAFGSLEDASNSNDPRIADALLARDQFIGGAKILATEDFEGFIACTGTNNCDSTGTNAAGGSTSGLETAVGTFTVPDDADQNDPPGGAVIGPDEYAVVKSEEAGEDDHGRYNVAAEDDNTHIGGKWLDSNDWSSIEWDIPDASGLPAFTKIAFFLTDVNDSGNVAFEVTANDQVTNATKTIEGDVDNGMLNLVTMKFSELVSGPVTIKMANTTVNQLGGDGFGIDTISVATVPLPASALLLLGGLGGLGGLSALRRRKRTA